MVSLAKSPTNRIDPELRAWSRNGANHNLYRESRKVQRRIESLKK